MRREELDELHYITPIDNVVSILSSGILSHQLAAKVHHTSVAMQEVQDIRMNKVVPGGRNLHEYANTYFNARNAMLYLRKDDHAKLCVLLLVLPFWTLLGSSLLTEMQHQLHVLALCLPD